MIVKHMHLTIIVLTFVFFAINLIFAMKKSPLANNKFLKITPHILYTLFIVTFIYLVSVSELYPFVNGWASSKLAGFVFYLLSITLALKWAKNNMWRIAGAISAVFWLIVTARLGFADRLKIKGPSDDIDAYLFILNDTINAIV